MSDSGRSRLDALRSQPVGGESASTVDPVKLVAYRHAFDHLPADEQHACLARLRRGQTYEQIALDLGAASAAQARGTVTRAMDRLLRDVFGGNAPRSERLADLLGEDAPPPGDLRAGRAPADMSPEEEALLRELLVLAKTEPPLDTWGKFTDLKEIGSGGFGTVYSAMDPVLQTRVALKLYHPHRSQRPTEELLGEARKLARVRHPNVVVVHGADEIDGRVGVWMELVEGDTLDEEVRVGPRLDAEAAAEVGIAICQALEAVHAAGVVHGDIKAQNVVRGTDGRIVLMDFGAARFRDPSAVEAPETRAGTPAYMAPELFRLRGDRLVEPTVQSDVYAVGVLLFYLVTGKHPVRGRSVAEIRDAHGHGEQMLLLAEERPDLLEEFARIVERALARTPDQRWLTAAEMGEELTASMPRNEQPVRIKRLVQAVAVAGAAGLTVLVLGFVATRAFEVFLNVPQGFWAGLPDYFVVGGQLLIPMVASAGVMLLMVALPAVLIVWGAQALWSKLSPSAFVRKKTAWDLLQPPPGDPRLWASVVCIAGAACWLAITFWFADIFVALAALSELPNTTVDLAVLSPEACPGCDGGRRLASYHKDHNEYSVYLSMLLGAVLGMWFPSWERRVRDVRVVRLMKWATIVVMSVSLAAAAVPRRVLWDEFDVVRYRGEEAFVVGSNDDGLMLFDPNGADRVHWSVSRDDPALVDTGATRKLFERAGD